MAARRFIQMRVHNSLFIAALFNLLSRIGMCVVHLYERCAQSERVTHAAACALFVGMICDWCLRDAAETEKTAQVPPLCALLIANICSIAVCCLIFDS
jgi:hypothetical protein